MRTILDIRPFSEAVLEDAVRMIATLEMEVFGISLVNVERIAEAFMISCGRPNHHGFIGYIDDYPMCMISVEERFSILEGARYGQITEVFVEPPFRGEGATQIIREKVEEIARLSGWSHIKEFEAVLDRRVPDKELNEDEPMTDLKTLVESMTAKSHAMLPLNYFAKRTGITDMEALYKELMEICDEPDARLEAWAIYRDRDGEEQTIEVEDFAEYRATGELVCPTYGVIVKNPEEQLSIYWARKEDPGPEPL